MSFREDFHPRLLGENCLVGLMEITVSQLLQYEDGSLLTDSNIDANHFKFRNVNIIFLCVMKE